MFAEVVQASGNWRMKKLWRWLWRRIPHRHLIGAMVIATVFMCAWKVETGDMPPLSLCMVLGLILGALAAMMDD